MLGVRYFGKLLQGIEAAEEAWHRAAETAIQRAKPTALLRVYAGGWPIWQPSLYIRMRVKTNYIFNLYMFNLYNQFVIIFLFIHRCL